MSKGFFYGGIRGTENGNPGRPERPLLLSASLPGFFI
jgi:hypothetical protein